MTEIIKKKSVKDLLSQIKPSQSQIGKPKATQGSRPGSQAKPINLVKTPTEPKVNHGKTVNFYVEYEDGVVALAQGAHADLIYRFTMESQKLSTMYAYAYYEGPAMTEMPKKDAIALLQKEKEVK
jgi:hypothetical protein